MLNVGGPFNRDNGWSWERVCVEHLWVSDYRFSDTRTHSVLVLLNASSVNVCQHRTSPQAIFRADFFHKMLAVAVLQPAVFITAQDCESARGWLHSVPVQLQRSKLFLCFLKQSFASFDACRAEATSKLFINWMQSTRHCATLQNITWLRPNLSPLPVCALYNLAREANVFNTQPEIRATL